MKLKERHEALLQALEAEAEAENVDGFAELTRKHVSLHLLTGSLEPMPCEQRLACTRI